MIYLASPYSHEDPLIMKTRFMLAEQVTAILTKREKHIYSPIVHYHEMALKYEMPTDFEFWRAINFDMIRRSDALYILTIPGLEESKGVKAEIKFAMQCGIGLFGVDTEGWISAWQG